ncbi:acyl carrier protein [Paenibacillus chitinolyticus]|uniref:acyl carrier protein n=1 Tax=Paenibacillus chitinolyticus TaxID=79263 RepID=UPI0026E4B42C|nr:acyl carrier protein [Paenibacillus chitinolyticus]GKS11050.1 hypothetical protein YDYSY3_20500 [Paenibacillus chitinolyticus]
MSVVGTSNLDKVRQWILDKNQDVDQIDLDLDLIENRVIDSLQFIDFILLLEELSGKEISMTNFSVNQVQTLRAINENFLGETI